jgi:hypothetical protein
MRIVVAPRGLLALSLLASLAMGCKEGEDEMGELITREVIGPMGGSISGSGLTLEVPAGALTADTELELRTSMTNLTARDFTQDGDAVDIGPAGMRLRLPASLTFDRGPDEPAVLFRQDDLTVAAIGSSAWINELNTVAIATAGVETTTVLDPPLGDSPSSPGMTFRDLAHFRVALTESPTFNVAMTLYDTEQVYDKPLNGNGDGDCGFELSNVLGGSLSSGCSEGPVSAEVRVTSAEIEYDVTPYLSGKLDTPVVVGVVGGSDELAFQLGFFSFDTSPCYSETCSGYGTCEVQGESAACLCNEGYAPGEELSCVCVPDCSGRECGGDGCGGGCGPGCNEEEFCQDDIGQCVPNDPTDTDPTDTDPTDTDPTDTDPTDPTDTDPSTTGTTDPTDPTDPTTEGGSSDGGSSGTTT